MPDWLGYVIAGFVALAGVIWAMLNNKIDKNDKAIWDQIGRDSESGMRKNLHGLRNEMSYFVSLESRLERLEKWRNGKP